ncbi:hypothetical protein ABPG77_001855 [Micractinium sp. CCAP 211/92]
MDRRCRALAFAVLWCWAATQALAAASLGPGRQRGSRALLHTWPSLGSGHSSDADGGPGPQQTAAGMQGPVDQAMPGPLAPPATPPPPARGQWVTGSPFASGRGGLYIGIMVAGLVFLAVVMIVHKRGMCGQRRRLGAVDGTGSGQRAGQPAEPAISTALPPTKQVQLVLIEQPDNSVVYALEYEVPGSKEARTTTPGTGGIDGNGAASARSSDVASSVSAGSPAWAEEPERNRQQQAADGQRQVLGSCGSSHTSAAAAGAWGYRGSQSPPPPS